MRPARTKPALLLAALALALLAAGCRNGDPGRDEPVAAVREHVLVFVGDDTRALLDANGRLAALVATVVIESPGDLAARALDETTAGVIVDDTTATEVADVLPDLYRTGRIVAAIDVHRDALLMLSSSAAAFTPGERRLAGDAIPAPRGGTSTLPSPFASIIARTPPGGSSVGGSESMGRYEPNLFAAQLASMVQQGSEMP